MLKAVRLSGMRFDYLEICALILNRCANVKSDAINKTTFQSGSATSGAFILKAVRLSGMRCN